MDPVHEARDDKWGGYALPVSRTPGSYHRRPSPWPSPRLRGEGMVAAEPLHTSAKHGLSSGPCFSRRTASHFG